MHLGDGPDPPLITPGTMAAEFMNSFNYLGFTVTNTGDLNRDQLVLESCCSHNAISLEATLEAYMH